MSRFSYLHLPADDEAGNPDAGRCTPLPQARWGGGAHAHLLEPADDSAPRDGVDRVAVGTQPLHLCQRLVRMPVARHGHNVQRGVRGRHVLVVHRPRKHALRATAEASAVRQPAKP